MDKRILSPIFLISFLAISLVFLSCKKEPEIIIETVTVIDTITIVDTIILVDTITLIETIIETQPDTATTFILLRHAETTGGGSNPNLSTEGQNRASELSRILGNVQLTAVFSTNFNRTLQTADSTANDKGLAIEIYNPSGLDAFVDSAIASHKEEPILVVGHSNTTPSLLNILVGANIYSTFQESEYDNLFIVTVFEKGRSKVVHLKYGE